LSPTTRDVLLDECLDWRLARDLKPHRVSTVAKAGWSGLKNGVLLRHAAAEFDVFVTVDRNLSFQQKLIDFDIAVLVLQAPSNRLSALLPLAPKLVSAIATAKPGHVVFIH